MIPDLVKLKSAFDTLPCFWIALRFDFFFLLLLLLPPGVSKNKIIIVIVAVIVVVVVAQSSYDQLTLLCGLEDPRSDSSVIIFPENSSETDEILGTVLMKIEKQKPRSPRPNQV